MRSALLCIGALVAAIVLGALAVDLGEVVTLTTSDASGGHYETQLWIVEHGSDLYLRSGTDNGWLERLREDPEVILQRNGTRQAMIATPLDDEEVRTDVNRAMELKYGAADRFLTRFRNDAASIAVRLVPKDGAPRESEPAHP